MGEQLSLELCPRLTNLSGVIVDLLQVKSLRSRLKLLSTLTACNRIGQHNLYKTTDFRKYFLGYSQEFFEIRHGYRCHLGKTTDVFYGGPRRIDIICKNMIIDILLEIYFHIVVTFK